MLIGIHRGKLGRFPKTFQVFEKILDYNGINHIRVDINDPEFWENVKKLDLFIFNFENTTDQKELAKTIIPVIERELKVACFPDVNTAWSYDDKIKEYYLLKQAGFPVINNYIFWQRDKAIQWAEHVKYPVVFKLKAGSQSDNVILVKGKSMAIRLIRRMFGRGVNPNKVIFNFSKTVKDFKVNKFIHSLAISIYRYFNKIDRYPLWDKQKNYVIFQEFLSGNDHDTRITVIGRRAFGFIRYNRDNDFRASGSGKKEYDPSKIDKRCLELAFQVSDHFKFQSMAYDFLYNGKGDPVICEMSYTFPPKGIYQAPGYWDRNLEWHPGHYWPQYLYLNDLLGRTLRQPEIKMWEDDTLLSHISEHLLKKGKKTDI